MKRDPEPLDALREDWQALVPPAPVRPLADEDAETRTAVDWMRSTWNALEAPEPGSVPTALTRTLASRPAPRLRLVPRIALALAAGLVAWFGFAVLRPAQDPTSSTEAPVELASVETAPAPSMQAAPIVLAANTERVELRSGSVRLVLLQPPATNAGGSPR